MDEWPKRTAGTGQQSAESKPCGKKLISIFSDRLLVLIPLIPIQVPI